MLVAPTIQMRCLRFEGRCLHPRVCPRFCVSSIKTGEQCRSCTGLGVRFAEGVSGYDVTMSLEQQHVPRKAVAGTTPA